MTDGKRKAYAADGVDVKEEASFSSFAGKACKATYSNSPFVEVTDLSAGQFRGPRPYTLKNLPEGYLMEMSADGLGTKGILIDAADCFETAAFDLIAMTASDITRYGGLPLIMTNILDLATVGVAGDETSEKYKRLISGLKEAATESNLVVLKGETAQMSACIGSEILGSPTRFNWGATMLGVYHKDKVITGESVAAGQKIVALKERGFRCNGISSVRKALGMNYGPKWWDNPAAAADIKAAAAPSILYDRFVNTFMGWYDQKFSPEMELHAIVHLSGGGIKEKLGNDLLFAHGLGAELDDLFVPAEIMQKCALWRGISDHEFYEAWNGGQGMLLVVNEAVAERCVTRAADFGLEAKICGTVTDGDTPAVTIHSKLSDSKVIYGRAD